MIVSVIYQIEPGQKFDLDYYMKSHVPLVGSLWGPCGLKGAQVLHGIGSPSGAAPAKVIALLDFESLEAFQAAVEKHGSAVLGDIANFTEAQPVIQFNEQLA
jgi:uncharacterized protein (TIGR02118 family)